MSRPLSVGTVAATVVAGLLPPAFNISTGAVVGSVARALEAGSGRSLSPVIGALALATAIYVAIHLLGPIRESLGAILMRRVDAALNLRVMKAVMEPRGIAHLENPAVLDKVTQAQGVITAATPGAAAYFLIQVWAQRLQASASLAIVAGFHPGVAVGLLAAHAVAYRWARWHWREVTSVIFNRTEGLRRSHYIRRLAVEPEASKEARVFGLAGWLRDTYRRVFIEVMEDVWRQRRNGVIAAFSVTGLLLIAEAAALLLIVRAAVRGDISVAAAVVFAQSVVAASNLGVFTQGHVYVADGAEALRVLEGLERTAHEEAVNITGTASAEEMPRRSIVLDGLTFRYPGREDFVFRGLDLEIEAGRSLAVVGENGAGKTTLVKLLARMYDPTEGRILIDGIDLRELDPASWQRRVAAIFQDFVQYRLSAADNVAFGALHVPASPDALDAAARHAGADRVVASLPSGWSTPLSRQFRGGSDISGGEWQRLALARAVYAVQGGAGVLILDEPTAALDVRGEAEVYNRFLDLTRGLTTIVISHRFSTVRRADRIVVIEHGAIVEDGTHDELVGNGRLYSTMYRLQAARFSDEGLVHD